VPSSSQCLPPTRFSHAPSAQHMAPNACSCSGYGENLFRCLVQPKPRESVIDSLLRFVHTDALACRHDREAVAKRQTEVHAACSLALNPVIVRGVFVLAATVPGHAIYVCLSHGNKQADCCCTSMTHLFLIQYVTDPWNGKFNCNNSHKHAMAHVRGSRSSSKTPIPQCLGFANAALCILQCCVCAVANADTFLQLHDPVLSWASQLLESKFEASDSIFGAPQSNEAVAAVESFLKGPPLSPLFPHQHAHRCSHHYSYCVP